jgi:hypothetical protein
MFPQLGQRRELIPLLDGRFTDDTVRAETDYLSQQLRQTFERTYGWAWLLKLAAELRAGAQGRYPAGLDAETVEAFRRWDKTLQPLTIAFVTRFMTYLPKATYPIRVGTHQNSAFALALALDYARETADKSLEALVISKARAWYLNDAGCPAWEPDGIDFLSPCLMEAECVRRVLPADEFRAWFDKFLPNLARGEPRTLFTPATVSDRTDGQITHLDGLNLSRAWCWRSIARALDRHDPRNALAESAYSTHLEAALPHVTGDYMGEHWLATFALLAMTE